MAKHKEHFYSFLKLSDYTYSREWLTPRASREKAATLSRQSHGDVLVYKMVGAVRVRYDYEVSKPM